MAKIRVIVSEDTGGNEQSQRPPKRPSTSPIPAGTQPRREREGAPGAIGPSRLEDLPPIQEYSDEELVTVDDLEKATSPLDDVPLAMLMDSTKMRPKRKTKDPLDPALRFV